MRWKLISDATERTYVVVLDRGDEVVHSLQHFIREQHVTAARVTAIGAFRRAELAFFDPVQKVYVPIYCGEQVEALSCLGDVTVEAGHPKLHLHAVLGRRDGTALGGHLVSAEVYPTFEVMIVESPAYLQRVFDPAVGLSLIQLPAD